MKAKLILVFALCALAFSFTANAQQVTMSSTTYADATIDTTQWFQVDPLDDVSIWYWADDSCNTKIFIDGMVYASGNDANGEWGAVGDYVTASTIAGDTLVNESATANTSKGWVLRHGTTNRIPGAKYVRLRIVSLASGAGVTSPTQKAFLLRRFPYERP